MDCVGLRPFANGTQRQDIDEATPSTEIIIMIFFIFCWFYAYDVTFAEGFVRCLWMATRRTKEPVWNIWEGMGETINMNTINNLILCDFILILNG